jgi:hypothetical protein
MSSVNHRDLRLSSWQPTMFFKILASIWRFAFVDSLNKRRASFFSSTSAAKAIFDRATSNFIARFPGKTGSNSARFLFFCLADPSSVFIYEQGIQSQVFS